jgi:hypothetical protein
MDLPNEEQRDQLAQLARQRNWGLSLLLVGWLHLIAFLSCHYLTIEVGYHEAPGYALIWGGELLAMWLIFRICGGPRSSATPIQSLELLIRRIWTAYFLLVFNLGSLNALRGHLLFEFFPAVASLASFAFLMMTLLVNWRFAGAVLVMFVSGLLMASNLMYSHLVFALAWWLVLNGIGWPLWLERRRLAARP